MHFPYPRHRARFRELKTSSARRMTLPLSLQVPRHFLMIIAVITARAQCREISIGKMRSLDDGARRVQLSTTPRRDRIARVFLRLPHDFLVFSDNPPWLKFARHRCSLAASLWFLVKNYSRKDSLRIRRSVRGEVERSFAQR